MSIDEGGYEKVSPVMKQILTDLIADLRYAGSEIWDHYGQFSCIPATPVKAAADRAEARMRELDEE